LANVPFLAAAITVLPVSKIKDQAACVAKKTVAFGSVRNGSSHPPLGKMFRTTSPTKLLHVPYWGAAPALTDLNAGQTQLIPTSLLPITQHK
jgi:tripartite-type tricarboxylate transporter receptor subunit TctC